MSSVPPPNWQPSSTAAPVQATQAWPAPRRVRSKLVAIGAAVMAVVGAAFVLLGSGSTKLTDPIAQAATLSSNTAGYRMHMSLDMSSPGIPSATGVGDGSVDLRDHLATASVTLNFGSNAATQALGGGRMRIDEILDGSTIFMKLPAAAMPVLGAAGKPWVKFDLTTLGHGPASSSLGSGSAMSDPSEVLRALRSASSSVVTEGRQRVDGIQTTLYHAELNLDQIAKVLPSADRAVAQGELQRALGAPTLPIDVWIDSRHLVRRMQMTLDATLPGGQLLHFGMTADLSDYGAQPRPALPPAAEVHDISALASAG
jgi:hypothetical protein